MYGYICPDCGAHLDPGEKCDCAEEKDAKVMKYKEQARTFPKFYEESSGQLKMAI